MAQNEQNEQDQAVFSIEKLYVKDLSVEVPGAPQVFLDRETPSIDVELSTGGNPLSEGFYEVFVTVTVTAKSGDKTVFLVEVTQGGVFQILNVPQEALEGILMVGCANILFPYAREAVSDAVTRAGFQPVLLSPVNFEAMYHARQQAAAEGSTSVQ